MAIETKKTRKGWVIETNTNIAGNVTGRRVLYSREQIVKAGYDYADNPSKVAAGEFASREEMLVQTVMPSATIRTGWIVT